MEYYFEEAMGEIVGMWASTAMINLTSFVVQIVCYVLMALGLYTIAQNRGIKHAWMAWIPVLDLWILGSIADQYRYVVKGQVKNRRTAMLVLGILNAVLGLAVIIICIAMVVNMIMAIPEIEMMNEDQLLELVMGSVLPMLGASLIMIVTSIVASILRYIACYDLFCSCEPENKVLYLVLGILFSVTMSIFVFICRNKDLGMPPRKTATLPEEFLEEAPFVEE